MLQRTAEAILGSVPLNVPFIPFQEPGARASMMRLRNIVFVGALCWWANAVPASSAEQLQQAARPDEGMPPQPDRAAQTPRPSPDERLSQLAALLVERCLACHGGDKQEGDYSVASFEALRTSGDSGEQPIVSGRPEASELYRRLVTSDEAERMPAESEPLESDELALLQEWIAAGAQVPATWKQLPLAEWPRSPLPRKTFNQYPAALPIAGVAVTPDGHSVWTSGYGEVIRWDASSGKLLERRPTAGTQIADVELSHDGGTLAVSSGTPGTRGIVEVWRLDASASAAALWSDTSSDIAPDIAFAPKAARLAVGRVDGSLLVVNLERSGDEAKASGVRAVASVFTPHADAVLCVAWSDSGERLMTGSRDRTAKIFDATTMDLIANYDRHQRAVGGVAYAGAHPVSFDETGQLRLWPGDDSDRTVAEQSNLPRFLERIISHNQQIYLADGADIRVLGVEKKETEDGKDDSGKPKRKTTTRWREKERLKSDSRDWIMSLDQAGDTLAAGTESGQVVIWHLGESTLKAQFSAKP